MMKRKLFVLPLAVLFCIQAMSQTVLQTADPQFISEDPSSIVTMQSIIDVQQDLTNREFYSKHISDVWNKQGFFNLMFHNPAAITLNQPVSAEENMKGTRFESQFGFALQAGKNYKLHKNPIAKMVSINLDYLPLDLYVNKFAGSAAREVETAKDGKYCIRPWDVTKWDANYSMSLGPSVTVAPFVLLKNKALSFFKLNAYYHVGYSASLLLFSNGAQKDKELLLDFGHGLYTSLGFNFSWKAIGLGYEKRSGTSKYLSINKICGPDKYELASSQNRLYINIRF